MSTRYFARSLVTIIVLFSLFALSNGLSASTVRQLSFTTLVADSVLIFTGEVVDQKAVWNEQKTHIDSLITFRVERVIKGEYPEETLILRFAGGEIGAVREYVDGMIYPEMGELGLYFVESLDQTQVNPLLGWHQGHFKRLRIDGVERVFSADGRALESVFDPSIESTLKSRAEEQAKGLAQGLLTTPQKLAAMPVEEFVSAIEAQLLPANR